MALNAPLLRTTTIPLWVHPLAWRLDHLALLHISVRSVPPGASCFDGRVASGDERLSTGFISSRGLLLVHELVEVGLLDTYLAMFIVQTVDTFQRELKSKPFRFESAE